MHRLGVSHTMLGWYFGNYPGLMIKSTGELSFKPFPEDEETFLNRLASVYWKAEDVPMVVEAWENLAEAMEIIHCKICLILRAYARRSCLAVAAQTIGCPLSPTWQIGSSTTLKPWPPSGDRIGECLWYGGNRAGESMENILTLEETVELCRRMSTIWDRGAAILNKLEPNIEMNRSASWTLELQKPWVYSFAAGIISFVFMI